MNTMLKCVMATFLLWCVAAARGQEARPPRPLDPASLPKPREVWHSRSQSEAPPPFNPQELQMQLTRLKNERDSLSLERDAAVQTAEEDAPNSDRMAHLRLRLGQLLAQVAARNAVDQGWHSAKPPAGRGTKTKGTETKASPEKPEPSHEKPIEPKPAPPKPAMAESESRPVDPLSLGRTLFRSSDFAGALAAFRRVDMHGLKVEERRPVQYFIASCLHRLGKNDEAVVLFREVASSKGDEVLAECAQWQLSAIQWSEDIDKQARTLLHQLEMMENKR